jgi:hypothetical protein
VAFGAEETPRLVSLAAQLRGHGVRVASSVARVELWFRDPAQPRGTAHALLQPAAAGGPRFRQVGAVALSYDGLYSAHVRRILDAAAAHLSGRA